MAELNELVKVVWNDAHGSAANVVYDIDEIPHGPIECTSYGLLLKEDDLGISIASECVGVDTYRGYSFIPAKMTISVEPVNPKKVNRRSGTRAKKLVQPLVESDNVLNMQ